MKTVFDSVSSIFNGACITCEKNVSSLNLSMPSLLFGEMGDDIVKLMIPETRVQLLVNVSMSGWGDEETTFTFRSKPPILSTNDDFMVVVKDLFVQLDNKVEKKFCEYESGWSVNRVLSLKMIICKYDL